MDKKELAKSNKQKKTLEILQEVMDADQLMLKETSEELNQDAFLLAVDTICQARDIYIIGVRNSAPLAQFLAFYLNPVFRRVRLIHTNSASEIYEQMLHVGAGDAVIGISFPRYSMRVLKALEFANSRNAKVITITDTVHSPVNLYSSCNLLAKSHMCSIVDSLTPAFSLLNALIVAICMRKKKRTIQNLEELDRIWDDYPVNNHDEINRLAPEVRLEKLEIEKPKYENDLESE